MGFKDFLDESLKPISHDFCDWLQNKAKAHEGIPHGKNIKSAPVGENICNNLKSVSVALSTENEQPSFSACVACKCRHQSFQVFYFSPENCCSFNFMCLYGALTYMTTLVDFLCTIEFYM